jgi:hypothetical protein
MCSVFKGKKTLSECRRLALTKDQQRGYAQSVTERPGRTKMGFNERESWQEMPLRCGIHIATDRFDAPRALG